MKAKRVSLMISLIVSLVLVGWWTTSNIAFLLGIYQAKKLGAQGRDLFHSGKYYESMGYLDKALAINPNFSDILDLKGTTLLQLGKYNESIAWFDKALAINSNFIYPLIGKGVALVKLGKYNESIIYLDRALSIHPDINALNYKQLALTGLNRDIDALNYKQLALKSIVGYSIGN